MTPTSFSRWTAGALLAALSVNCGIFRSSPPPFPADGTRVVLDHRGDCMPGFCPFFSIEIRGDGTVIYQGDGFAPVRGVRTSHVSPEAAHALFERFVRARFFDMNDVYDAPWVDVPMDVLTFEMAGRKKRVVDRPECHHVVPKAHTEKPEPEDAGISLPPPWPGSPGADVGEWVDTSRGGDPPRELCELERAVDSLAHIEQWGLTRDDQGVRVLRR
jgi:hypothetical protein